LIQVENISKHYGRHIAVEALNFTVQKGEILGFLGPNGAGKSTTMNIITGYLSATSGSVKVDGLDILEYPRETKAKIGYLPESPPLYAEMTVAEYLDFVGAIKKVPPAAKQESLEKIMDLMKIGDVRGRLIKNLSKGYKQRVGLAQALIGNPRILILDEPTAGLDPKQIIEIRGLIRQLGQERTIILSSHILPEVSAVCERVIIINRGRIAACDTPENLSKGLIAGSKLILRVAGTAAEVVPTLQTVPGVKLVEAQGVREAETVDILVAAEQDIDIRRPIFQALSAADRPILMMRSLDLSLEEIFLQVTTEEQEVS
jgi:ABC-2 type transport system ATP-binding protein